MEGLAGFIEAHTLSACGADILLCRMDILGDVQNRRFMVPG
jgi:hypothetical protein